MSREYSEDKLIQQTTASFLADPLGWQSVFAYNNETYGEESLFGRYDETEVVLTRSLLSTLRRLNPGRPDDAYYQVLDLLTSYDAAKTLLQINAEMYAYHRDGVPVTYRTSQGIERSERLRVFDFKHPENNDFLAVRELWVRGPIYRRRPDIIGFVNGLPLLFIELKKHHKDLRVAFDQNLSDYRDTIPHLFYHNAFIVLANGLRGRLGSLTSKYEHFGEWKRLTENDPGKVDFQTLLLGVCVKAAFMDLFENFILFDKSKAEPRKIIARNHQYLGVNQSFAAVQEREVRAGKLGVFWHTQGAGKSYSMAFLSRKVHRKLPGDHTFLLLTDRLELDKQLYKTFVGIGEVTEGEECRATSGAHLKTLLEQNHRYVFSLIHKFNLDNHEPYSQRNNLIVFSDEAHRTQYGLFARRMRFALPHAAYMGFTGTPLLGGPGDQLTRQIFGDYVSVYDFYRAVEDGSTVPLYYDNRGEKLGITTENLNEKIADVLDGFELDEEKEERVRRALSQEYAIITAPARLERIADDFVAHYTKRWQTGKAMIVCVDKLTTVRLHALIEKYWQQEITNCRKQIKETTNDQHQIELETYLEWLQSTQRLVVVSEEQNEVRIFHEFGLDIIPHRRIMKDPSRDLEEEFKKEDHPFRVAIVCAMWLTGFDVEALSTLYIDKPMKMHTLMQTIARANRVKEGKPNGLIVDYNGLVKSLRQALAVYASGANGENASDPLPPVNQLFARYDEALQACSAYLSELGFELSELIEAEGFDKLEQIKKGVEAICLNDETRARFRASVREVLEISQTLLSESRLYWKVYKERQDALEALFEQIEEHRQPEDISNILNDAYQVIGQTVAVYSTGQQPGGDSGKLFDISKIDIQKLKQEFERSSRKNLAVQTLKERVEKRLEIMLRRNPYRMDFSERFQKIVDEYNQETDRTTIEKTFEALLSLVESLSEEEQRSVRERLDEESLVIFDLLCEKKSDLPTRTRNRIKKIAKDLIEKIKAEIAKVDNWREKDTTRSQIQSLIYNYLYDDQIGLPLDVYNEEDVKTLAEELFKHIYVQYPDAMENVYS
jgi:type I restriction enzyme R subunit